MALQFQESILLPPSLTKIGFQLRVLGSGSSGNCSLISHQDTHVLVDAGFSYKEIDARLQQFGVEAQSLTAVLVTHEHGDHIRAAHTLSRRLSIPVFTSEGTYDTALREKKLYDWVEVFPGRSFQLGAMTFHPISLPHDASDPVGFRIECEGRVMAHMTDFGYVSGLVRESLRDCDLMLLEANHDLELLRNGPYPWSLKQRIASKLGHLSNDAMLEVLQEVAHDRLEHVVFGHLSDTNNNAQLLRAQIRQTLRRIGLPELAFSIARQDRIHDVIEV